MTEYVSVDIFDQWSNLLSLWVAYPGIVDQTRKQGRCCWWSVRKTTVNLNIPVPCLSVSGARYEHIPPVFLKYFWSAITSYGKCPRDHDHNTCDIIWGYVSESRIPLPFAFLFAPCCHFVSVSASDERDITPGDVYSKIPACCSLNSFEAVSPQHQPIIARIDFHRRSGNKALSYLFTFWCFRVSLHMIRGAFWASTCPSSVSQKCEGSHNWSV